MAYTPLALFRTYTNIHQDDEQILLVYLDTAEAIVEQYLCYSPEYQQYTNRLNGNGGYAISLRAKPIHIIQEVIIDGVHVPVEQFYIEGQFLHSKEVIFSIGKGHNVVVSYTAGYDTVSTPTANDEDDTVIDGGDAFSEYGSESETVGALIIPPMPSIITMTVLRIASILESESNSNIGVTSKSFGDSGSRSFINYTNFDKYLLPLSSYRILAI
jgi:hypothetical protein